MARCPTSFQPRLLRGLSNQPRPPWCAPSQRPVGPSFRRRRSSHRVPHGQAQHGRRTRPAAVAGSPRPMRDLRARALAHPQTWSRPLGLGRGRNEPTCGDLVPTLCLTALTDALGAHVPEESAWPHHLEVLLQRPLPAVVARYLPLGSAGACRHGALTPCAWSRYFNACDSFATCDGRPSRNPYWLSAGRESDAFPGRLEFSQPEVWPGWGTTGRGE